MKLLAFLAWALCACAPASAASFVNPVDYGAIFDGVTDDTTAWSAAVAAATGLGLPIKAPCGSSAISAPIVLPATIQFSGSGSSCTKIVSTASIAVNVTTADQVLIEHLTIVCASNATGININAAATNIKSEIADVGLLRCGVGANMGNAANWTFHDSNIGAGGVAGAIGILVANPIVPDSGDSAIYGNLIVGNGGTGSVGISQRSSGGLRIENNKILLWTYGYLLQLASGVATSDLVIVGNSIEHSAASAIAFNHSSGGSFANVVIVGNQIGAATPYCVTNAGGAGWLSGVGIIANRLTCTTDINMPNVTGLVTASNF